MKILLIAPLVLLLNLPALAADLPPDVVSRLQKSVVTVEYPDGSSGTGFFIDAEGHIVTCSHVITDVGTKPKIRLQDGTEVAASLMGFDPDGIDLALLRAESAPAFLEFAAGSARVGERVYVSGNPYPLFPSLISTGIVGLRRDAHELFVHDASSSSGSSGSPVVNAQGEVVGISVSEFFDDDDESEGKYGTSFNSAIDVAALRRFVDRVRAGEASSIKTGHVEYLRYPLPALATGFPLEGKLTTESDRTFGDLSYAQGYILDLQDGQQCIIRLRSESFDPYLFLHDHDAEITARNDDATEDTTDAEIVLDVAKTGRYTVIATSYERGEKGPYRLSADILKMGSPATHEAVLEDSNAKTETGSHFQEFPFEAREGQWVVITMRSKMFDSHLRLLGPDGSELAENDDWKEDILDSRLFVRIKSTGKHSVVASSVEPGTTGTFILEIANSIEDK